ncbi:MAG: hypothetical protein VX498_15550 [Myxococcota bacterium]|nr:hypothetical protein [Myxococcota bacterium]
MCKLVSVTLTILLLGGLAVPSLQAAPLDSEEGQSTEAAPEPPVLTGKALRSAIRGLDGSDTGVRYARSIRLEGNLGVAGGASLILGAIVSGFALTLDRGQEDPRAKIVVGFGVPLGVGLLIAGLPSFLAGQDYLAWYATHRSPPSELSRLKLLHRWRLDLLRARRNASLLGSAFVAGAAVLAGIVWAEHEEHEDNGTRGVDYDHGDAVTVMSLVAVSAGLAALGLSSQIQFQQETRRPHPLFALSSISLGVGPCPGASPDRPGYRAHGVLSVKF